MRCSHLAKFLVAGALIWYLSGTRTEPWALFSFLKDFTWVEVKAKQDGFLGKKDTRLQPPSRALLLGCFCVSFCLNGSHELGNSGEVACAIKLATAAGTETFPKFDQ